MKRFFAFIFLFFAFACGFLQAQSSSEQSSEAIFRATVEAGDTVLLVDLPTVYCFPPYKFKNKKEEQYYWRLVRDVKKTLPLSKLVRQVIVEVNDTLMRIPTVKERNKYMKKFERETYKKYEPTFKNMTFRQGKLLIRLIDRECEASSYELIRAYRGSFRAGFWQFFAKMFGADLKSAFGNNKDDEMIERIILLVENGQL